jgi:hypothetical protein
MRANKEKALLQSKLHSSSDQATGSLLFSAIQEQDIYQDFGQKQEASGIRMTVNW